MSLFHCAHVTSLLAGSLVDSFTVAHGQILVMHGLVVIHARLQMGNILNNLYFHFSKEVLANTPTCMLKYHRDLRLQCFIHCFCKWPRSRLSTLNPYLPTTALCDQILACCGWFHLLQFKVICQLPSKRIYGKFRLPLPALRKNAPWYIQGICEEFTTCGCSSAGKSVLWLDQGRYAMQMVMLGSHFECGTCCKYYFSQRMRSTGGCM
jgi:hypothetical protein